MSPALVGLAVPKVVRVLESADFSYVRTKGSHAVYRNPPLKIVSGRERGQWRVFTES
jgi:predicted RNA binding protein YcfA (HicA-like mRNA interferase family)